MATEALSNLIRARGKALPAGFAYQVEGGLSPYGMDVMMGEELKLDEARMGVFIPYADGNARDGVGDLIEVAGIDLSRHRQNPVVLYDHGKQVTLPVGLAQDPDTNQYTVQIDPAGRKAGAMAYFYQGKGLDGSAQELSDHARFCCQLYDLMCKRFVRGGSIGYTITHARELPPDHERGVPKGLHLLAVKQLELSAVVMPCNQDTVRKSFNPMAWHAGVADAARRILCMGRIAGEKPSAVLVKSLAPLAAPRPAQLGWEPGMAHTKAQPGTGAKPKGTPKPEAGYHKGLKTLRAKYRAKAGERAEVMASGGAEDLLLYACHEHSVSPSNLGSGRYQLVGGKDDVAAVLSRMERSGGRDFRVIKKGLDANAKAARGDRGVILRMLQDFDWGPLRDYITDAVEEAGGSPAKALGVLAEWQPRIERLEIYAAQPQNFQIADKPGQYGTWAVRRGSEGTAQFDSKEEAIRYVREVEPKKRQQMLKEMIERTATKIAEAVNATAKPGGKSLPASTKTRMADPANTSGYAPGDKVAAREYLSTSKGGKLRPFAAAGERLTVVASDPGGRILCQNRAGEMEYFSSAQVRKTKAMPAAGKALDQAKFTRIAEMAARQFGLKLEPGSIDAPTYPLTTWRAVLKGEGGDAAMVAALTDFIKEQTGDYGFAKEVTVGRYMILAKALPSEHADVTPEKARKILKDGHVNGQPLTEKQRGMFGAIAGGKALPVLKKDASPEALKEADFIELPEGVQGTNCGNCKFQEGGTCRNPNLDGQPVTPRNCCAYWDADGTQRPWQQAAPQGKSLSAVRTKYRSAKSVRRRLKSSTAGSSLVVIKGKDVDAVRDRCKELGVGVKWLGGHPAGFKAKLTGDDGNIDAVANQYGQPI